MSAPARRSDAAYESMWSQAVAIRRSWLRRALATEPADRDRAEHSLARIYAGIRRPRPRFEWVDSPAKALPLLGDLPTLDALYEGVRARRQRSGQPPLASDLAVAVSRLRSRLSDGVTHTDPALTPVRMTKKDPWPDRPARDAFAAGTPLGVVLHYGIRTALHTSLVRGVTVPVRAALGPAPVCWYGQQDAFWIGYYDALRSLGLARYGPDGDADLDDWAALAGSANWWWPGEDVCVVADRPAELHTEPVPDGWHEQVRLAPAGVVYRDGWCPVP